MCNTKYQLADSATVYDDLQGSLVVILGQQGRVCRFRYSQQALDLLEHLQQASTPQDIINDFSQYTQSSILSALEKMISAGIVKPATSHHREVRCLLIGCGSIGSHIFRQLSVLPLQSFVLVDSDVVDTTNIYRQDYYPNDTGYKKTSILSARPTRFAQIRCISDCITTEKQLTTYIKKYNINLVIQAADAPSTNQLAHIINSSCNENHIPYIINPGYMGNAVSLPEFFYPNDTYQYTSSHDVVPGKVIFRFQHSKLSYRLCSELACLVAQQVEDFRQCAVPTKYGEKGYFDTSDFTWHTTRVVEAPEIEPDWRSR